jgi:hypothetical protein
MKVTHELLVKMQACDVQCDLFNATFPSGCTINETNLVKAARARLDLVWFFYGVFYTCDNDTPKIQKLDSAMTAIRKASRGAIDANYEKYEGKLSNPIEYAKFRRRKLLLRKQLQLNAVSLLLELVKELK